VYEGDELVSTYQAKDIKPSECPKGFGRGRVGFANSRGSFCIRG
jgi:hypothetical protein